MTLPLKDENEAVIGVITFTLMVHADILSNLIHGQTYGKTGETYLVNKDAYMLTESRFTTYPLRTNETTVIAF